jgi:hypothetical protein
LLIGLVDWLWMTLKHLIWPSTRAADAERLHGCA